MHTPSLPFPSSATLARARRWATFVTASVLCVGAVAGDLSSGSSPERYNGSVKPLPLTEYITQIDSILLRNDISSSAAAQSTARQVLESSRSTYAGLQKEAAALSPPAELLLAHLALLKGYGDSVRALTRYLRGVPPSAPASDADKYLYRDAENAYAVAAVVAASCEMDVIARDAGLTMQSTRSCINVSRTPPKPDNALGTPLAPLSTVTLTHEPLFINTPEGSFALPRVRYTVGRIYAKAGTPFVFNFINNNSAPFKFNLAIYRGNDVVLDKDQLVASTVAGSGPGVLHTLTLKLKAGTYAFIDNVHPEPLRGQLIVVD